VVRIGVLARVPDDAGFFQGRGYFWLYTPQSQALTLFNSVTGTIIDSAHLALDMSGNGRHAAGTSTNSTDAVNVIANVTGNLPAFKYTAGGWWPMSGISRARTTSNGS
jgi:hypothetical protein